MWVAIIVASVGCYLLKLAGLSVPSRLLERPLVARVAGLMPVALLAALSVRRDNDIYATDGGWFRARWHFSFDDYRDPENMGIGTLRVFNHDTLVPGAHWPMHPHRDVEGISYFVNDGRSLAMVPERSVDFAFSFDSLVHVDFRQRK